MKYIILNEGAFSSKALRSRMQSFAWADAKLCVGDCKALLGQMQSFALAVAKLCDGGCKALRLRWTKLAEKRPSYS
ncbi:MAG: hypothetical protein PUD61_02620 [Prevotella sp.]|nr:hypothetical protein [Prevotella sp.]